jgi:Lipoprotein LpqB beta-propeller domain/Sporulation and spore germination
VASPPRLTRWLTRGWQAGLVAALVAAVAGCVGMPSSGAVGNYGADQENTAPAQQYVGPFVSGPGPTWTPRQIVQGFLDASANYPADAAIAKEYLVSSASNWDPGWSVQVFNKLTVFSHGQSRSAGRPGGQHALVDVTGTVLAAFNSSGSGQYVSAQGQEPPSHYQFNLVKVDGLWRISNPPSHYRLLAAADFPRVYKAQDLYFFDSQDQVNPLDEVLVPYSVFVPLGTSPEDLVTHLAQDLTQDPSTTWLQDAAVTAFPDSPGKTTVLNVSIEGATATVNLGGAVTGASKQVLQQISAQLVWTIAGSTASPSAIQSIELEINGKPQTLPAPCGAGQGQSPVQKLAAYECYDPYPAAPASFYYAANGLAWSRCGPEAQAGAGYIGPVVPLVGRGGVLGSQPCGSDGYVPARSPAAASPAQPRSLPAMSMAAVSPDGKYLALVPPGKDAVYVGPLSGPATSFSKTPRPTNGPGPITALSWDRDDDLWVAQGGDIVVMPADGKAGATINQGEYVTGLSVAPDGVRIALIVRHGPRQSELQLGAISRPQSAVGEPKSPWQAPIIDQNVQLGPNLTHPDALTWYDADDLIVLNGTNSGNTLWEVPVDGQQAGPLGVLPPGAVSITADGAANALVAGLSDGQLAISAGLYGPWQTLAGHGQDPAYPGLRSWVIGDEMGTEPRPQRYAAVM